MALDVPKIKIKYTEVFDAKVIKYFKGSANNSAEKGYNSRTL